jgi:hypothetical protein
LLNLQIVADMGAADYPLRAIAEWVPY